MAVTVMIKDESGSGRVAGALTLDGVDERITRRDLVRTRVREEVARYNSQREEGRGDIFAGLVMPEGAEPAGSDIRFIRLVQLVGG